MKLSSKVKLTMVSLGFVCLNLTAQSQTFSEGAFLFSQTNNIGSARTMGLGGAQVSLGGDISLAYSNPAGLGMSNRSFYTFSGGFVGLENIATYENNPIPGNSTVVNIPQLGVAFHKPGTDNSQNSFKGGTFAISYNQTNNFRQEIAYGGNGNSSIVDFLLNRADGVLESDLMSDGDYFNDIIGLAYDVYLIDPEYYYEPTIPDGYYVSIAITPEFPYQTEFITNKGSQREWDFSYGANFDDKIFIGFGLGFSSFKYSSTKVYEESFNDIYISKIVYNEKLSINGNGINATFGVIVRPIDLFQVGISVKTPTLYTVNDEFEQTLSASWKNVEHISGAILNYEEAIADILVSDYTLKSPAKISLGGTLFLGKAGFITADIERINYSGARLNSYEFSMSNDNQDIIATYAGTTNMKIGGEMRYDIFRMRAGLALLGDPYASENFFNASTTSKSIGVGIRKKDFFVDFAYVHSNTQKGHTPYNLGSATPEVLIDSKISRGIVSVGFNF